MSTKDLTLTFSFDSERWAEGVKALIDDADRQGLLDRDWTIAEALMMILADGRYADLMRECVQVRPVQEIP